MNQPPRQGSEIGYLGWVLLALWVVPPLLWLGQLQMSYSVASLGCDTWRPLLLYSGFAATIVIAVGLGAYGWRAWRQASGGWPDESRGPRGLASFVALIGLLLIVQIVLVMLAQGLAIAILAPCS